MVTTNLEKIVSFDNVPRKRNGFINFVKNSCRVNDTRAVESMWSYVEKAGNEGKEKPAGGDVSAKKSAALTQTENKKRRWSGWEKECTLFVEAGEEGEGEGVHFEELAKTLSTRYAEQAKAGCVKKRKVDTLSTFVLSQIPENFLSDADSQVRVPK